MHILLLILSLIVPSYARSPKRVDRPVRVTLALATALIHSPLSTGVPGTPGVLDLSKDEDTLDGAVL